MNSPKSFKEESDINLYSTEMYAFLERYKELLWEIITGRDILWEWVNAIVLQWKNKEGKSVPVPGLILNNKETVRRFVRSLRRQEEGKTRRAQFTPDTFKLEDHLETLKDYNVKLEI